jgi:LysR family glycine cleavage system transcriptional activator
LPPLPALRAFEAAARHLSFKRAAEALSVTPTAISHQVKLLEDFCGMPLFRRRPRPLQLTVAGEHLLPAIRSGFNEFATAFSMLEARVRERPLVVTTTNAFASRWLVRYLPRWRADHPEIELEIIGTDDVLDLANGEADVAIRYMFASPLRLQARELFRDTFICVCSPGLLPAGAMPIRPRDLEQFTLIHGYWSPADSHAPTWDRCLAVMRASDRAVPALDDCERLRFKEELHMIDAAIGGLGIAIVGDLLVSHELDTGSLVRAMDFALPGYGYYLVNAPGSPRRLLIDTFADWLGSLT